MWFVYLLECSDCTLYCGIATDVEQRLRKHNAGKGAKYVASRRPARVVYIEECESRSSASKREYRIKKMSRRDKLDLIGSNKTQS